MINKLFRIFIVVFMLVSSSPLYAQSPYEIEGQMDEIKLNENMIYGEDFNANKDIAYDNALSELLTYANELRVEKGKEVIKTSDLQPWVKELRYTKGSRYIVLVYMPLSQMFSLTSKSRADIVSQAAPNQSSQNNALENETDVKPESETRFTFVPNNSNSNGVVTTSENISHPVPLSNDILDTLCSQDNWVEIKGFLITYKKEGKISSVGNVLSYAEVPEDAYAILMDEMGGILSILSPKNSEKRINYRTNQEDNETNYSNCKFIVWYR